MRKLSTIHCRLPFLRPAGTSRGVYTSRDVWYVIVADISDNVIRFGIGECSPLPDLSCDASPHYGQILSDVCRKVELNDGQPDAEELRPYPSILFGLETAFRHLQTGSFSLWDTPFAVGEQGIPINGLIWMGDYEDMLRQIDQKMQAGFRCIKLKIGAINFDEELKLLKYIRRHFPSDELTMRVDANGAFAPEEAYDKLSRLAELDLHSIEQPVRAGQWDVMSRLADISPLPIALDEELIGVNAPDDKRRLLETIRPRYIVLKPTLHGGFAGCEEWIKLAESINAGWWITSALESNIGLNAIAQWCASMKTVIPQGLGTGALFARNIPLPLEVRGDCLWTNTYNMPPVTVQTSGSTGKPKTVALSVQSMINSANLTCDALQLTAGNKALLCMPLQYVGSKMMIARTITAGLDLDVQEADGHPLANTDKEYDFVAMTPQQAYNSLSVPEEKERLKRIKKLIIGGGAIPDEVEAQLKNFRTEVYSTYGMTETVSHIALRRLSGVNASDWYEPFKGIELSLSEDNTLLIKADGITDGILQTNDIAELKRDGRFRILGRKDNVINSGGVKLQIEELENKMRPLINRKFAVTAAPDRKFGEAVVLLVERLPSAEALDTVALKDKLASVLGKYERPKQIIEVAAIPTTPNGKIDRSQCKSIATEMN
jgi:o-succinylbenzoate synthase